MKQKAASRLLLVSHLVVATAMVFSSHGSAGTLAYDGFDYPSGLPLNGQSGGFGWDLGPVPPPNWSSASGLPNSVITAPGLNLSYSTMLPVLGNAYTSQYSLASRQLDTSRFTVLNANGNIGETGTDLWFSFLVRDNRTLTPAPIWGGLRLFPTSMDIPTNNLFIGKFAGTLDTTHQWGIGWHVDSTGHADAGPGNTQIIPTAIVEGATYLLVGHFVATAADEQFSLYINPGTVDTPPGTPDAQITVPAGSFFFSSADFEAGESLGDFTFDELTFGTDYKSVALTSDAGPRVPAPVPEPGSAALLGLGTLLLAARRRRSAQA